MADAGVGEAAAAEGAKSAGEAAAVDAGAAGVADAGLADAGVGLAGAGLADAGLGAADAAGAIGGDLAAGEGAATAAGAAGAADLISSAAAAPELGSIGAEILPETLPISGIDLGGVAADATNVGSAVSEIAAQPLQIGASGGLDVGSTLAANTDIGSSGLESASYGGDLPQSGIDADPFSQSSGLPQSGVDPDPFSPSAPQSNGLVDNLKTASNVKTGSDTVDKALKQLNSVAPYALMAMSAKGQGATKANGNNAAAQLNALAAPVANVESSLLSNFQNGQISAADQSAIAQWQQQQKAAVDQYYAKAGLSNSSMHADAVSKIGQQADAMRQQAVQNLLTGGLKAAGIAQGPQMAAIQAQLQSDQQSQLATQNFLQQLAKMMAAQGTTTKTTP